MSCLNPIYAVHYKNLEGRASIRILGRNPKNLEGVTEEVRNNVNGGNRELLKLPCGQCDSCKKARVKQWAIRCVLEASLHKDNFFVTLTYRDDCYPGYLSSKDFRKFIKNVRNKFGQGVRFFGCSECGSSTFRFHHHVILFNLELDDLKPYCKGPYGGNYFTSKKLESCWPYGFITIGEVSYSSCSYVAQYCMKKLKTPSKIYMSRRPGIGYQYFLNRRDSIYDCDRVYLPDGKVMQPPRYFDKLLAVIDEDLLNSIKSVRINDAKARVISDIIDHSFESEDSLVDYEKVLSSEESKKRKDL